MPHVVFAQYDIYMIAKYGKKMYLIDLYVHFYLYIWRAFINQIQPNSLGRPV